MLRIGIQLDFAGEYGRGVLRGVMQYANQRGNWEFVMPPMYRLTSKRTVEASSADGIVTMLHDPRSLEPFRKRRVPVVNTARTMHAHELERLRLPSVLPDDAAAAQLALDYFTSRGFRSFGFCGHPKAAWSTTRRNAFVEACERKRLPCTCAAAADHVPAEWIDSLPRPCAILAANDRYAWHCIDACREAHIAVPEDVAVLGVDNDALLSEMVRPSLSSIILPTERIGFEAARLLDEMMQGKPVSFKPLQLSPEGIATRHSTDVLSLDDADVADAARFIREHAASAITVKDVIDHVPTSRRNLERRFKRALGRSLHDEIRRVHLDRAMKLLRETELEMPRIAEQSGFASQIRFSTVFREMTGTTPTAYRRDHRPRTG